jgi:1,4-alpha-glucan branching enzyme
MEEEWLFEAITETYVPLLLVFERLLRDDVDYRLTLSMSPTLLSMLTDDLLKERYATKIDKLVELAESEVDRTRNDGRFHGLAQMYRDRFVRIRDYWRRYDGDLVHPLRGLQDAGKLEVITCTATHPFIPFMDRNWAAIRAQVHVAADVYERAFGRRTQGMWLGECGYVPGLDELLREENIRYFFLDTHGLLFADRRPVYGVHAPIYCPTGVAAFGRDVPSSRQVWSSKEGYPGDPDYRDFYRDIGFDLPIEYVRPYIHPDGIRTFTGVKYHAITHGALHNKNPYVPHVAWQRANAHAQHFLEQREQQVRALRPQMDRPPIIVSPYDAELFGHWWYEGPIFLEMLLRKIHTDQGMIAPITPSAYLHAHPTNQVATPAMSSWGAGGYGEYWCNQSNAWIYRHLHKMGERMVELARRFSQADDLQRRVLNQAARELMLAQASDWAFIMKSGTTVAYATQRTNDHINRFHRLTQNLEDGDIDEDYLAEVERRDNLFPNLDYRVFAT